MFNELLGITTITIGNADRRYAWKQVKDIADDTYSESDNQGAYHVTRKRDHSTRLNNDINC
jgi:hypothetical protein